MAHYADCYFLVNSRSVELLEHFLNRFLPSRAESAVDYIVEDTDEDIKHTFENASEVIYFVETRSTVITQIYWSNHDSKNIIEHGMVFHTDDGKMILGVSIPARLPNEPQVLKVYWEIVSFLKTTWSCITIEEPPPSNSIEFETFCNERYVPIENS